MKRPVSPASGTSWEVRSRSHQCAATGKPFQEGDTIHSRLVRRVDGDTREDYREEAWTPELREESLFNWKTKFRKPAPKKEAPFKEENAEELLHELLEANDPEDTVTLYILALMLERKRLLLDRGHQHDPDGRQIRIYEHKDSGETFFIVDPVLDIARIAEVQQEVALRLGWIQPEPPEAEPQEDPPPGEGGEASAEPEVRHITRGDSLNGKTPASVGGSVKAVDPEDDILDEMLDVARE